MKTSHHGQMSESFLTAVFLSLSGGLQDAYTYLFRGKVFANAQTGNIVLLSANLMDGIWERVLHYLVPLCAFALGVLTAEKMRERFRGLKENVIVGRLIPAGTGYREYVHGDITVPDQKERPDKFLEDLEENPVIEKDLTEIRQETREINHALKQELQEEHRELKESTEPRKK